MCFSFFENLNIVSYKEGGNLSIQMLNENVKKIYKKRKIFTVLLLLVDITNL